MSISWPFLHYIQRLATSSLGGLKLLRKRADSPIEWTWLVLGNQRTRVRKTVEDLILPRVHTAEMVHRFYVVACTGENGIRAIVNRIQEKMAASLDLQPLGGHFEVSGQGLDLSSLSSEPEEAPQRIAALRRP